MSDSFTTEQLDAIRDFIRDQTKDEDYFEKTYEVVSQPDDRHRAGSFGHVKRVRLKEPDPDESLPESGVFAIKAITIPDWRRVDNRQERGVETHMRQFYQACYEAVVVHLYNLAHPNIVKAYSERHWIELPSIVTEEYTMELLDFLDGDNNMPIGLLEALIGTKIYMVFEWFEHDIRSLLPRTRIQDERRILTLKQHIQSILLQVAFGLGFLHKNDIVHGDLKIDNVLVNPQTEPEGMKAAIGDSGLSKNVKYITFSNTNEPNRPFWVAPDKSLTKKFDIWSFGFMLFYCSICTVFGGIVPGGKFEYFKGLVDAKEYDELRVFLRDNLPDEHGAVRELIVQCVQWDPSNRPDYQTLQRVLCNDQDVRRACEVANQIMVNQDEFRHSEQIIFPNFIRNLLAISDDPSIVRTLHPELSGRIREALERDDPFPIMNLFTNCDARLLNEFALFVNNANLYAARPA